jgi:cytochrome c biogenesis protein CcdA
VPLLSAFLFGLLGATAPCQLSTNMGAIAFLARRPSERAATLHATLAYIGAKLIVYTAIGLLVLLAGREIVNAAGPYLEWPRKLVGPLMILLGLAVGGVIGVRVQMGQSLAARLERRATSSAFATGSDSTISVNTTTGKTRIPSRPTALAPLAAGPSGALSVLDSDASVEIPLPNAARPASAGISDGAQEQATAPGAWSSFLLGAGFSLAFCPTLFVLFFGATLGIAARSAEGFTLPAIFALGTVVPVVALVGLAMTGSRAADRMRRGIRRANKPLRWLAAGLLVLLGLHDTLVYWFL